MNVFPHKKLIVYKRWVAASFLLMCLMLGAMLFGLGKIGQKPADQERRLASSPLTSADGLDGGWAKTMLQVSADPGSIRVTSFAVVRPALSPGERTSIRVSIGDDAHGAVTYVWKADAGSLSAADTNPVVWTAPQAEGHYQVRVEVTNAAGSKSGGSAGILVSRRPAAQLVMSVDPMGGKQRSTDVAGASAQTSSGD